ncbi:hypothetical protein ACISJZ_05315, partial [Campylobacter coli]
MRILLILRGNYYAGQEEFIKENRLKDYTLDLNSLRLLSGSVSLSLLYISAPTS